MNEPLISVIIPAYNCEKTISTAIDSIVNQTYRNIEIIVVDDVSTDKTVNIVRKLSEKDSRIKIVQSENDPNRFDNRLNRNVNAGFSARNTGFKFAKGEYITFQDADDASFLNRIEIQLELLKKYDATHVTTDWIRLNERLLGKKFDMPSFIEQMEMLGPKELYKISQRSKGFVAKISETLNSLVPFHLKRKRIINKLFFGSVESYPGVTGIPLFKREVIDKVKFRRLSHRVWPSFMGRGADRDFSFQIAEVFKNSYVFLIPLYLWRVKNENPRFEQGIDQFII